MKVEEFFISEINKVLKKELLSRFDENKTLKLYNKVKQRIEKDDNIEEILSVLKSNKDLSTLSKTIKYFELLLIIEDNSNNKDFLFIEKQIEQNTSDKILITIWAIVKRKSFDTEEFLDIELIEYYDTIFSKYSFVLNFDDFLEITDFFYILFNNEDAIKDMLIPVLENAINKHPHNLVVVQILINIYIHFNFISKAERLIEKYILVLDESKLNFDNLNEFNANDKNSIYLHLREVHALINYKLGYYNKALEDTKYILNKVINTVNRQTKDDLEGVFDYELSLLIQLSIYLKEDNNKKLKSSLEYLKYWPLFIPDEWDFPEIINYLKENDYISD